MAALAAVQQYLLGQAGNFTPGNVATAAVTAALLCLMVSLIPSTRGRHAAHTRTEVLRVLRTGILGIAGPVLLLTWSREVLTSSAFGLAALVTVAITVGRRYRERPVLLAAIAAGVGTLLLIGGRMHSLGFTPVRSLYLGLVSGGVTDLRRTVPALAGVIMAGCLLAVLHVRAARGCVQGARNVAYALAPVAVVSTTYAFVTGGAVGSLSPWYVASGVCGLLQIVLLLRVSCVTNPSVSAVAVLISFLPFTIVHARMQGLVITQSMLLGGALVVLAALSVRRRLKQVNPGAALDAEDR